MRQTVEKLSQAEPCHTPNNEATATPPAFTGSPVPGSTGTLNLGDCKALDRGAIAFSTAIKPANSVNDIIESDEIVVAHINTSIPAQGLGQDVSVVITNASGIKTARKGNDSSPFATPVSIRAKLSLLGKTLASDATATATHTASMLVWALQAAPCPAPPPSARSAPAHCSLNSVRRPVQEVHR